MGTARRAWLEQRPFSPRLEKETWMNCDLCTRPLSDSYSTYTSDEFRLAARAGVRPPATMSELAAAMGLSKERYEADWLEQVRRDTTGWACCPGCAPAVDRALGRAQAPASAGGFRVASGDAAVALLGDMQKQAEAASHVDKGARALLDGRYEEAERELAAAIAINPSNATAHGNMGGLFLRRGEPDRAIPWLEKALELNPSLEGVPAALAEARRAAPARPAEQIAEDVVVSADGGGRFATIVEAVKAIAPGFRVVVKPGVYRETIVLEKPVAIVGDGPREQVVIEAGKSDGVFVRKGGSTLRGLTIRCLAGRSSLKYFGVDVEGGEATLEDCDVTSDSLACVAAHGAGTRAVLRGCDIHHGSAGGLFVFDHGEAVVEGCDIHDNSLANVETKGSTLTIAGSRLRFSRKSGLYVHEGARATLRDCDVHGNDLAGIEVKGAGTVAAILGSRVFDGKQGGIFFQDRAEGTVEDSDVFGNGLSGVEVKGGARPAIRRTRIHDGKQGGLFFQERGEGTVEDCEVFGNALAGVEVKRGAAPVVRRCRIHDGRQGGVLVDENGAGTFEECEVYANALAGLESRDGATPTFRLCTIRDGARDGLYIHDRGAGLVEECVIEGNREDGVEISKRARPTIRACRITKNGHWGVSAAKWTAGRIEACTIAGNAKGALDVPLLSLVRRKGNRVGEAM